MKKENKKLAQQKRAEARKKQQIQKIVTKVCQIGIPVLLFIVFVVVITVKPFSSSNNTATGSNANSGNTNGASYSADASLTVKSGDTVNIDYVGSIDGVEFAGGNTQGMGTDLTIGSRSYIDDFEEQLIGYHPGDKVMVTATFPENYGKDDLNGKDAVFEVVINGIYR